MTVVPLPGARPFERFARGPASTLPAMVSPAKGETGKHLSVTLSPIPGARLFGRFARGPASTLPAMVPPVKGETGKHLSVTLVPLPGGAGTAANLTDVFRKEVLSMKITYLGTAASEGLPAPFCTCEVCRRAREAGGKSVRTRSQALVDESLLIDFPPDTYLHWLRTPFDFLKVTDLLVTHSHMDHWYPDDVQSVVPPYGHHDPSYTLTLHGNERVIQMLEEGMAREEPQILETVPRKVAKAFETFAAGDYQVTPLPADHCYTEKALFYLIEKGDKALLYAHDTGYFLDPVWEYLASRKDLRLGLVSLDCTHGWDENRQNHMGFTVDAQVRDRLVELGRADGDTLFVCNHFSHNGGGTYEEQAARAKELGLLVSYDGLTLEF